MKQWLLGWLCIGWFAWPAVGATNFISGSIDQSVSWSGANRIEGTVVVPAGVSVTIQPGARLLMGAGARLQVLGQLLADGTAEAPISITRASPTNRWKQIQFIRATASRFRHCVIEYADCAGDHKDYYDDDCNPATPFPARSYHEAVVVLASHVEVEDCVFQNLPDAGSNAEGDAMAVVSDDPLWSGPATARVAGCRFLSIGQGVHTRYAFVLVERCYFYGHSGDNDDVDLYGESLPPPLIQNNVFTNAHDDFINPTRCSAIISGNVFAGSTDHGIVLRDQCSPVVVNNLIYNCSSGGVAIQNQCDALLVNNTIVNCAKGIKFFDHTGRWGPPYCLNPGSGKATLMNCLIWDCPTSLDLADSPYTQDRGSHATVLYCDIEGGRSSASVSAHSTLDWGPGNLDRDPAFADPARKNYRLLSGSPCIDGGTNLSSAITNLAAFAAEDPEGIARPLDGNGDGATRFDIGAFEFLLAAADSNSDGIPDGWCHRYGLNPTDARLAQSDGDGDRLTTFQEWVADTDPTNPASCFRLEPGKFSWPAAVSFDSSTNRLYTLFSGTGDRGVPASSASWTAVPGQVDVPGASGRQTLVDSNTAPVRFYRVSVRLP